MNYNLKYLAFTNEDFDMEVAFNKQSVGFQLALALTFLFLLVQGLNYLVNRRKDNKFGKRLVFLF